MKKTRWILIFISVLAVSLTVFLGRWQYQRYLISLHLPEGLSLSQRIPVGSGGNPNGQTVEATLNTVGAHLNESGNLVDGDGWRIEFRIHSIPGIRFSPDQEEELRCKAAEQAARDAANKIRVIIWSQDLGTLRFYILRLHGDARTLTANNSMRSTLAPAAHPPARLSWAGRRRRGRSCARRCPRRSMIICHSQDDGPERP